MAASIPSGSKFWYDGVVLPVVINGSNDAGTEKFWYDGQTFEGLSPTTVASDSSELIAARSAISML